MKAWPILGILIVQALLCLAHWFLYSTWIAFWWPLSPAAACASAHLAHRAFRQFSCWRRCSASDSPTGSLPSSIRSPPSGSACSTFSSVAACLAGSSTSRFAFAPAGADSPPRPALRSRCSFHCCDSAARLWHLERPLSSAFAACRSSLHKLPDRWRGRTALVFSDLHLGNINGVRFARRIAAMAQRLNPDIIFIPGDLFDGTKADPRQTLQRPSSSLRRPSASSSSPAITRSSAAQPITLRRSGTPAFACSTTNGSTIDGLAGGRRAVRQLKLSHAAAHISLEAFISTMARPASCCTTCPTACPSWSRRA